MGVAKCARGDGDAKECARCGEDVAKYARISVDDTKCARKVDGATECAYYGEGKTTYTRMEASNRMCKIPRKSCLSYSFIYYIVIF